jgi:hypothetical protein
MYADRFFRIAKAMNLVFSCVRCCPKPTRKNGRWMPVNTRIGSKVRTSAREAWRPMCETGNAGDFEVFRNRRKLRQ